MKLVLAANDTAAFTAALASSNAVPAVEALGNARDQKTVPLLLPLVAAPPTPTATRKACVRALAQVQEGASGLLALAKADQLPADVKLTASAELNAARWPEIKTAAAQLLPPPSGQNAQPLPPVGELLKKHFNLQVYRAMSESVASEHGARMSAMENATNNAREMINKLTLTYNKLRQEKITTELTEIVSGAEALK